MSLSGIRTKRSTLSDTNAKDQEDWKSSEVLTNVTENSRNRIQRSTITSEDLEYSGSPTSLPTGESGKVSILSRMTTGNFQSQLDSSPISRVVSKLSPMTTGNFRYSGSLSSDDRTRIMSKLSLSRMTSGNFQRWVIYLISHRSCPLMLICLTLEFA